MSRTLHAAKVIDGRIIFGTAERDKTLRKDPAAFERAQARKKARAEKRVRNIARSLFGKGVA